MLMYYDTEAEVEKIISKLVMKNVNMKDKIDCIDHGELVAKICHDLGVQIGLREDEIDTLCNAATLHDIGKLKLSKNIYGRDKKSMHVEEVKYMRTHAKLGADMLKKCGYPKEVVEIVLHHHECYDGNGYPDNLAGEDIPYFARILKVCDAFAQFISDRPYRPAYDRVTAMGMMIEQCRNFDMKVFLSFMTLANSPEFDSIIEFADEINKKHEYTDSDETETVFS